MPRIRRRLVPPQGTALRPVAASSLLRVANTFGTATAKSGPGGSPVAAARAPFVEAAIARAGRRAAASSRATPCPSTPWALRPTSRRLPPPRRHRPLRSEVPAGPRPRHRETPILPGAIQMGHEGGLADRVCDGRAGKPARYLFADNHFRHDRRRGASAGDTDRPTRGLGKDGTSERIGSGVRPLVPIDSLQACREGGTHAVPFQDRDHDMTMDRRIMIFFFAARSLPIHSRRPLDAAKGGQPLPSRQSDEGSRQEHTKKRPWGSEPLFSPPFFLTVTVSFFSALTCRRPFARVSCQAT